MSITKDLEQNGGESIIGDEFYSSAGSSSSEVRSTPSLCSMRDKHVIHVMHNAWLVGFLDASMAIPDV